MGKTRPPYPAEFRAEALSILRSGARTPAELARELGCTEQTLRTGCARTRPTAVSAPTS